MAREWKPGDVAMLSSVNGEAAVGFAVGVGEVEAWRIEDGTLWGPRYTALARPLVVIDPEDREQVERLYDLYFVKPGEVVDRMQAALREFANPTPPKPDEPTGLGAVVKDAKGVLWIRADGDHMPWLNSESSGDYWQAYEAIDAVRVLSEGVQP